MCKTNFSPPNKVSFWKALQLSSSPAVRSDVQHTILKNIVFTWLVFIEKKDFLRREIRHQTFAVVTFNFDLPYFLCMKKTKL